MRGTNNSVGAFLGDQAPEYQRDDKGHLTHEALPSNFCNNVALEQAPARPTHTKRSRNPFKQSHRTFWVVIQDIEAAKEFHKHENYKHRDAKAFIKALDRLIHQYNLQHKNKAGVLCQLSGGDLHKILQSIWGPRKSENVQPSKTIWLASKRDWDSTYLRMIEEACKELTLDDESLPVCDPSHAEPCNIDAGWHGEKGSRFGRADPNEDERNNEIAGAKMQGDKGYTGQPALEAITISSMIVASPLTQSPTPEPQRYYRKSSPKRATFIYQDRSGKQAGFPDTSRTKASDAKSAGQKRKAASSAAQTTRRILQKPEAVDSDQSQSVFLSSTSSEVELPSLKEEIITRPNPASCVPDAQS